MNPNPPTPLGSEPRFLRGPQSRRFELIHVWHIAREYFSGLRRLHFVGPCVTVFGSARLGEEDPAYAQARRSGELLARAGFNVMTGGGPGIMEAANRGAKEGGGYSIGCTIQLPKEQTTNAYIDLEVPFKHFFVRKVMLVKYSYGFIALAGGFGTYDEVFESSTLIQTHKVEDFPIVLLGSDFWNPLIAVLRDTQVERGTINEADVDRFYVTDSPDDAVRYITEIATRKFNLRYDSQPKRSSWLFEHAHLAGRPNLRGAKR